MKNKLTLIVIGILSIMSMNAQCDIKTDNRPDNNIIKYFNPKPVIRQSNYEVGVSIYKNITTDVLMINVSVLFKKMNPTELNGNLIIQTTNTNTNGIELKPVDSELMEMNGRDVAIGLYEIQKQDFEELKNYKLKSIFFYLDSELIGSTITENSLLLSNELNCLIDGKIIIGTATEEGSTVSAKKVDRRKNKSNTGMIVLIVIGFFVVMIFIYSYTTKDTENSLNQKKDKTRIDSLGFDPNNYTDEEFKKWEEKMNSSMRISKSLGEVVNRHLRNQEINNETFEDTKEKSIPKNSGIEFSKCAISMGKALKMMEDLEEKLNETSDCLEQKETFLVIAYIIRVGVMDRIQQNPNWVESNLSISIPTSMFSSIEKNLDEAINLVFWKLLELSLCSYDIKDLVDNVLEKGEVFYEFKEMLPEDFRVQLVN